MKLVPNFLKRLVVALPLLSASCDPVGEGNFERIPAVSVAPALHRESKQEELELMHTRLSSEGLGTQDLAASFTPLSIPEARETISLESEIAIARTKARLDFELISNRINQDQYRIAFGDSLANIPESPFRTQLQSGLKGEFFSTRNGLSTFNSIAYNFLSRNARLEAEYRDSFLEKLESSPFKDGGYEFDQRDFLSFRDSFENGRIPIDSFNAFDILAYRKYLPLLHNAHANGVINHNDLALCYSRSFVSVCKTHQIDSTRLQEYLNEVQNFKPSQEIADYLNKHRSNLENPPPEGLDLKDVKNYRELLFALHQEGYISFPQLIWILEEGLDKRGVITFNDACFQGYVPPPSANFTIKEEHQERPNEGRPGFESIKLKWREPTIPLGNAS